MWTIPSTSCAHPLSDMRREGKNRCVMGFAVGYQWPQIAIFVKSLRETAKYQGDIVLWTNGWDPTTRVEVERYGVISMIIDPPLEVKNTHTDIAMGRWRYYIEMIYRSLWDSILLADVRDLLFQADPLGGPIKGLHVGEEDGVIGQEPFNTNWIRAGWGTFGVRRLLGKPVLCSGAIWGSRLSILNYADMLLTYGDALPVEWWIDREQGISTWLIHTDQIRTICHPNSNPVWHIGLNQDTDSYIEVDQGFLLRPKDQTVHPAIIHQWDRHPRIVRIIQEYYEAKIDNYYGVEQ